MSCVEKGKVFAGDSTVYAGSRKIFAGDRGNPEFTSECMLDARAEYSPDNLLAPMKFGTKAVFNLRGQSVEPGKFAKITIS